MGFTQFVAGELQTDRMMVEVHPHACFAALLGRRPFLKGTLEGRLQRQLVLYVEGFEVANPVHVLEEITRRPLAHRRPAAERPVRPRSTRRADGGLYGLPGGYQPGARSQVGDRDEGIDYAARGGAQAVDH